MNQATLANQSIFLKNLINLSKVYKKAKLTKIQVIRIKKDFKAEERSVEGLNSGGGDEKERRDEDRERERREERIEQGCGS